MNRFGSSFKLNMFPLQYRTTYCTPEEHQPPNERDLADNILYPNMNSVDFAARPSNYTLRLHDFWDAVTCNDEGHLALATNKRDGREWWGAFFGFDKLKFPLNIKHANFSRHSPELITKLLYVQNNILLTGLADGRLQVWSTYSAVRNPENPYLLFMMGDCNSHMDAIDNVSLSKVNTNLVVSTCVAQSLIVWDLSTAELKNVCHIKRAHNAAITGLDTSHKEDSLFATCARNGVTKLWDTRQVIPATHLYEDEMLVFTALNFATQSEQHADNIIYLGDYDGDVHTLDIRVPKKFLQSDKYFKQSVISKILPKNNHLAVIGNRPAYVKISKASDHTVLYENECETNANRILDAIWQNDMTLITVGGRQVQLHEIQGK